MKENHKTHICCYLLKPQVKDPVLLQITISWLQYLLVVHQTNSKKKKDSNVIIRYMKKQL